MNRKPWEKLNTQKCYGHPCAALGNTLQLCRLHGNAELLLNAIRHVMEHLQVNNTIQPPGRNALLIMCVHVLRIVERDDEDTMLRL